MYSVKFVQVQSDLSLYPFPLWKNRENYVRYKSDIGNTRKGFPRRQERTAFQLSLRVDRCGDFVRLMHRQTRKHRYSRLVCGSSHGGSAVGFAHRAFGNAHTFLRILPHQGCASQTNGARRGHPFRRKDPRQSRRFADPFGSGAQNSQRGVRGRFRRAGNRRGYACVSGIQPSGDNLRRQRFGYGKTTYAGYPARTVGGQSSLYTVARQICVQSAKTAVRKLLGKELLQILQGAYP